MLIYYACHKTAFLYSKTTFSLQNVQFQELVPTTHPQTLYKGHQVSQFNPGPLASSVGHLGKELVGNIGEDRRKEKADTVRKISSA
jgi:hypothetical protein